MNKKNLSDLQASELKGTRVFLRADLNVPLQNGQVSDDTRILASLQSLEYLTSHGARVVLASHLGRPKGTASPEFSLAPVQSRLNELLKVPVAMSTECTGSDVKQKVQQLLLIFHHQYQPLGLIKLHHDYYKKIQFLKPLHFLHQL